MTATTRPNEPDLDNLRSEINIGLTNLAEGRVLAFDAARIAARGKALLAQRSGRPLTPPSTPHQSPNSAPS
jgi:hypothetical protein